MAGVHSGALEAYGGNAIHINLRVRHHDGKALMCGNLTQQSGDIIEVIPTDEEKRKYYQ